MSEVSKLVEKWRSHADAALRRSGTWSGDHMADRILAYASELESALASDRAAQGGGDDWREHERLRLLQLRGLLEGFEVTWEVSPLLPPASHLDLVTVSGEVGPYEGARVAEAIAKILKEPIRVPAEARPAAEAVGVPDGWRVMWFTGSFRRPGDRWEVYDPRGSGGVVREGDVLDETVARLLDAMTAAPSHMAPGDWVLVPRVATREMRIAGQASYDGFMDLPWKAMIEAAPKCNDSSLDNVVFAVPTDDGTWQHHDGFPPPMCDYEVLYRRPESNVDWKERAQGFQARLSRLLDAAESYECEIWQDEALVAGASGSLEMVMREGAHYALMYGQDGPVEIRYYARRPLTDAELTAAPSQPEGVE